MDFTSTDTAILAPPRWLVPGWIGRDHLTLMIGDGDSGKSTIATDLAIAIASGQTWMGVPTVQARVIYFDEDGARPDIINRMVSFRVGRNVQHIQLDATLQVHPASGLSIESDADFKEMSLVGAGAGLFIFDAMVAFHGQDENSAEKMRLIMRGRFKRLMRETGAAIVLIHHIPGPDENGAPRDKPRGSTEIRNASDALIMCKAGNPDHHMSVKRLKFARRLTWADPVSITLESTDDEARLITQHATKTVAATAFLSGCLDVLDLTVDKAGQLLAQGGIQVARETAWKALLIAQMRARSVKKDMASNGAPTERTIT